MKGEEQPIKIIRYSWKRSMLLGGISAVLTAAALIGLSNDLQRGIAWNIRGWLSLIIFAPLTVHFVKRLLDRNPTYILFEDKIILCREKNKSIRFSNLRYYEVDRMKFDPKGAAYMPDYINFYDDRNLFRFRIRIDNMNIDEAWLLSFLDKRLEKYEFLKGTYRKRG